MTEQTRQAVAVADVVMLLVDVRAGRTPLDDHFAQWLRKQVGNRRTASGDTVRVILVANKGEGTYVCTCA